MGRESGPVMSRGFFQQAVSQICVPEATLERFGLTRPFPGAAEADHIQLLGSRY